MSPCASSSANARRTVPRPRPRAVARSFSLGKSAPGRNSPDSICCRRSSASSWALLSRAATGFGVAGCSGPPTTKRPTPRRATTVPLSSSTARARRAVRRATPCSAMSAASEGRASPGRSCPLSIWSLSWAAMSRYPLTTGLLAWVASEPSSQLYGGSGVTSRCAGTCRAGLCGRGRDRARISGRVEVHQPDGSLFDRDQDGQRKPPKWRRFKIGRASDLDFVSLTGEFFRAWVAANTVRVSRAAVALGTNSVSGIQGGKSGFSSEFGSSVSLRSALLGAVRRKLMP